MKLSQSESLPCKPPLFTFRNSFCISSEEQWNRRSSFALTRVTTIWLPFGYHFNLDYGCFRLFCHPNSDSKWTIRLKVFHSFRSHVFKAVSIQAEWNWNNLGRVLPSPKISGKVFKILSKHVWSHLNLYIYKIFT